MTPLSRAEMDPGFVNFCKNASKLSEISNIIAPTFWPAASPLPPWGGVVMGMTSRTNVVVEMCEFALQFSEWDNMQKIFGTKNLLNDLTGRKFDDDFAFFQSTWDIADSMYDFESGERRKGSMNSAAQTRQMNDYMKTVQEYVGKKTQSQAEGNNSSSQAEIQAFAGTVAENANLKSAMNCPDPSGNPRYGDLYDEEVRPQEERRYQAERDREYFKEKLYEMGKEMYNGEVSSLMQYLHAIDRLEVVGVYQDISKGNYTETTFKPSKTKKNAKGHPVPVEHTLNKEYQIFTTKINTEPFTKASERFGDKWKSYVKWTFLQNSTEFGVFAGAGDRVEKKFRNLSYECSEQKVMGNYDPNKFDYNTEYEKRRQKCEDSIEVNEKKVNNLLDYYLNEYQKALFQYEDATAKIWTFESRHLGITRVVTDQSDNGSFIKENVKCSTELSPGEMKLLSQKIEANNLKMREGVLQNKSKQVMIEENEKEAEAKFLKEKAERDKVMAKQKEDRERNSVLKGSIRPVRGGINTGRGN